jgi:Bacterial alpha-L-rhamnosidase 6 hairpin glycosidase domain
VYDYRGSVQRLRDTQRKAAEERQLRAPLRYPLLSWTVDTIHRRTFLKATAAGIIGARAGLILPAQSHAISGDAASHPTLRIQSDPRLPLIRVLSWDTEGGARARTNLLRKDAAVGMRIRTGAGWRDLAAFPVTVQIPPGGARYQLQLGADTALVWMVTTPRAGELEMELVAQGNGDSWPTELEMVFPFDPTVTPATVLPALWRDDGTFEAPLLISAPDFGQMLLTISPPGLAAGRLEGSRANKIVNLVLAFPGIYSGGKYTFSFTPVRLAPPEGLQDASLWQLARRGWFNAFQPSSQWGGQGRPFSAPAGILANNVISDPCSFSLIFYADHMLWTPSVAKAVSVAQLVRKGCEFWLDRRTHTDGEIVGYWDYLNFLDANTGPVIVAWDYVEATGDLAWLERMITRLEFVADYLARRDQDHDGLVEATQSGNANTLYEPDRSCNWFDAVNHGHKDAYSNALIYRAWRCLGELETKLHRKDESRRYRRLADRLKAAYVPTLYNSATGWVADWRSEDGKLHDYASPVSNGMAVEYGLAAPSLGRQILRRLWAKMRAVGFNRFDLGLPPTLIPIHRSDYLQPRGFGCPHREDGSDTFQQYENGGITGGQILHFLAAHYVVGEKQAADRVLRAMLARQQQGGFQNGVQNAAYKGIDWTTWDGQPCGYEGFLADVYYFLQAVLLREASFRDRFYRPFTGS